jgi:carbonic anhydrase
MLNIDQLLVNNRAWVADMIAAKPDFFERLTNQQSPQFLWIGCSDSRVPANEIVGLLPGELFVHRNVANVVVHTDLNCLSVLQYAVEVLKVQHVIVCGHYGCGGVRAAMDNSKNGLIDNWLRHVQDNMKKHRQDLDHILDAEAKFDRICELNVIEQVLNVCDTTIVQDAWDHRQGLTVHGWVYRLHDGIIRDSGFSVSGNLELHSAYEAAIKRKI